MNNEKTLENKSLMMTVLNWSYSKAINGFTGVDSVYKLANSYLKSEGSLSEKVDSLIKWQVAKASTSGFLTGLGGFSAMPFTLPANVASVIYIQIRMISAIAYMGGYDIEDDKVKSMVFISLAGNGAKEILKDMSIKATKKGMLQIAQNSSSKLLLTINEKTSASLLSQTSSKGLSKLGKAIPLMGGLVGGTFDGISTNIVGKTAKNIFINKAEL